MGLSQCPASFKFHNTHKEKSLSFHQVPPNNINANMYKRTPQEWEPNEYEWGGAIRRKKATELADWFPLRTYWASRKMEAVEIYGLD